MRPEAPTRLDRAVLALASGTLGHLVGTLLELLAVGRERLGARRRRGR
ncbi:hypothetical protein [Patulibacter sp. SYSU D01012]|nr:hypothetical protein [Patulibacter sp. SYSU D01012]